MRIGDGYALRSSCIQHSILCLLLRYISNGGVGGEYETQLLTMHKECVVVQVVKVVETKEEKEAHKSSPRFEFTRLRGYDK